MAEWNFYLNVTVTLLNVIFSSMPGCFEDVTPARSVDGLPSGHPEHRQGPPQPLCSVDMPIKTGLWTATELVTYATICRTDQIIFWPNLGETSRHSDTKQSGCRF